MVDAARFFRCHHCGHHWEEPRGTGRPQGCPVALRPSIDTSVLRHRLYVVRNRSKSY
jgi:hypothetical protein